MHDNVPVPILHHNIALIPEIQVSHIPLVEHIQIHDADHGAQISVSAVNVGDQCHATALLVDGEHVSDPALTLSGGLGQPQGLLVQLPAKGILVVVENLLSIPVQHIDPHRVLLVGLHVGKDILLHPGRLAHGIVIFHGFQKAGGLGHAADVPQLVGYVQLHVLGHRPGDQKQMLLLLLHHHFGVRVVGVVHDSGEKQQRSSHQQRQNDFPLLLQQHLHVCSPVFTKSAARSGRSRYDFISSLYHRSRFPGSPPVRVEIGMPPFEKPLPEGGPAAVRWKIPVYFRSPPRQNGQQEPLGSGYFMSSLRPQWGQR